MTVSSNTTTAITATLTGATITTTNNQNHHNLMMPSSSSSNPTTSFLTGMFFGIGIATMFPNIFPNLEYYRRHFVYHWWSTLTTTTTYTLSNVTTTDRRRTHHRIQDKFDIFSITTEIYSMVLPNWIDRHQHMNNARYLYELNFARQQFFTKLQILPILTSYQCNLILQSQTIRYRKELQLWQMFMIEIRIIDWNDIETSFYIESKFVDTKTKFIHAIHYAKYRIVSSSTATSITTNPNQKRNKTKKNHQEDEEIIGKEKRKDGDGSRKKRIPTPTEVLKELQLIDEEIIIERSLSEDTLQDIKEEEIPEKNIPNPEEQPNEIEYLQQTKEKLFLKNSKENSFIVFWETANQISSEQLNPNKR